MQEWKAIPGYEGIYEISSEGRVRRLPQTVDHGASRREMTQRLGNRGASDEPVLRHLAERELRISINNGYRVVYVNKGGRKCRMLYIDKIVQQLFGTPDDFKPLPDEEWRPIAGYEGIYEVSNIGRVRSLGKKASDGRFIRPHLVAQVVNGRTGYPCCQLQGTKQKTVSVHRLVAIAFIPNPLGLDVVHHKDEDKTNCCADNLEWTSNTENVRDWFRRRGGDAVKRVATALGISEAEARKIILGDSNHS